jgi:selenocysteine lyase/cysteine desulfurase
MDSQIRAQFPAAQCSTYLNSAAIAPMPTSTVRAVAAQLVDVSHGGSRKLSEWLETKERVRGLIAAMLGVRAHDIAFTRNTSDGLCAVAAGMSWERGDNIVTFAHEFPANYYPWRKLSDDHGVELRRCAERDGAVDEEELLSMIDHRTRLVAISSTQYSTGYRVDLERIGRAARAVDALLVADIIQTFGASPLELPAQYVDAAAGASYKWLCAPEGCGIFYLGERARERIKPMSRGWTSVQDAWNFADQKQELFADTRAWETGMGGSAMFFGLEQSLKLIYETGVEKIAAHLAELTDFLCEIVPGMRYKIFSPRGKKAKSQIVSLLPLNGTNSQAAAAKLAKENIVVSSRGPLLRIAPHFFNDLSDIERLAANL